MKHFIRELFDYRRFTKKTPDKDKKIVFYTEHEGYYPNYEGIINELVNNRQQTICYISSNPNDPIFENENQRIKTFYIKRLLMVFMAFLRCRIFVMTLTDLNQLYLKRSLNPVHYVYIYHSMVSTHMMYLPGAFDYYDSILCVGQHHIEELQKYEALNHHLPNKQMIDGGYYRLERIYSKYMEHREIESSVDGKLTVLIAPSWGDGNVLESLGDRLIKNLLEKGLCVIVRPHPETVKRTPELLDEIESKYGENDLLTIERSVVTDQSLIKAEVMICDCSGVALEYAFGTERPVLFLDVPVKIRNENYKELGIEPVELSLRGEIGIVVSPEDLDFIPEKIEDLLREKDYYRKKLSALREKYVYNFGKSSQIGADYILSIL